MTVRCCLYLLGELPVVSDRELPKEAVLPPKLAAKAFKGGEPAGTGQLPDEVRLESAQASVPPHLQTDSVGASQAVPRLNLVSGI